jgi:hypothetical protein
MALQAKAEPARQNTPDTAAAKKSTVGEPRNPDAAVVERAPSTATAGASSSPRSRGTIGASERSKPASPPSSAQLTAAESRSAAAPPPTSAPATAPAAAVGFPANPAVFFHCAGAPEVCAPLRSQVDEALEKAGLASVRSAARADVDVAARVEGTQEKVSQQFGTTFAVRTYSIEVTAEATKTSEAVSMPASTTLSFDPQFGSERAVEKARLVAGDIADKLKAFAAKKSGR